MTRIVIVIVLLFFGISCSNQSSETQEVSNLIFDKMIGTWQLAGEDQYEQWSKSKDGSYSSRAFSVINNDTLIMEEVKVTNEAGKWNFVTLVKGQNKGKAITFTSTVFQDTIVQFENPAHDFPRMINYRLASQNNLQAFIGGTTDTIYFNFTRVTGK